ncbi:YecH family protein [Thalassotalea sp. G20_0]|uniref:YecH family metal-binding protein n=1 Tax=Thalassotalea sp. G20_0 TaxID=2821093 RepID=UPI001AD9E77C|nr:YecH family metal-binding protein [Thalassotalea sp. G20_0]MBO9495441.1 YecH family protein [Thalassotalea sp. G20_0]
MESVHGHNVLNMIREQEVALSKEALLTAMSAEFGEEARYHTCSAQELTAAELVDQFVGKGKLIETSEGIQYIGCNCHCH